MFLGRRCSWGTPLRRIAEPAGRERGAGVTLKVRDPANKARCVADAQSAAALGSLGRLGREAFSDLSFGDSVGPRAVRLIPLGRGAVAPIPAFTLLWQVFWFLAVRNSPLWGAAERAGTLHTLAPKLG